MVNRNTLISYALSFTSFIIDSQIGNSIDKIILFGSVARGDFDDESDIDLFIEAPDSAENDIEKVLVLFHSSKAEKTWRLRGIKNEISLKIGRLQKWGLRREVISSGIMLYGKYNELPGNARYYLMIQLQSLHKKKGSQQMKIWRGLYGYTQKVGKKVYCFEGLISQCQGIKIGKAIFVIPMEKRKGITDFLKKHKISYAVHEIWSDTL